MLTPSKDESDPKYDLHKRLYISLEDFRLARECAHYLAKKRLHYFPYERRGSIYTIQAALTTTLIVAYCRPFTKSRGLPRIPNDLINFTDTQKKAHAKILRLRNQVYAHSDSLWYKVEPWGSRDFITSIITEPFF